MAVHCNNIEVIKILLEYDVNINSQDWTGNTPLMYAIEKKDILLFLLQNGADVNKQNYYGWTPLYRMCTWGDIESIELLLNWGADPFITTYEYHTIFDIEDKYTKQFIQFYVHRKELLSLWEFD